MAICMGPHHASDRICASEMIESQYEHDRLSCEDLRPHRLRRNLKAQIKRMGKKEKDKGKQMEEEMLKRHAAELEAVDGPKEMPDFENMTLYGDAEKEEGPKKISKVPCCRCRTPCSLVEFADGSRRRKRSWSRRLLGSGRSAPNRRQRGRRGFRRSLQTSGRHRGEGSRRLRGRGRHRGQGEMEECNLGET